MTQKITTIVVSGASGRMGMRICQLAGEGGAFAVEAALVSPGSRRLGQPCGATNSAGKTVVFTHAADASAVAKADVVVDFSSDEGCRAALSVAVDNGAALVVGTTALSDETVQILRGASSKIGVLVAPNTSLGVAAVADAAARLARALGPEYRASIVEAHHIHKKDAPSGTALRLARAVRAAGGQLPEDQVVAIRGGDVIGEHTIRFAGPGEYIELVHRATTRDLFARGALRAAAWIAQRGPGWYTIEDVVGIDRA